MTKPADDFAKTNTKKNAAGETVSYGLRAECKACGNAAKNAKKAGGHDAVMAANSPAGSLGSVDDFASADGWSIVHGNGKYIKVADLSPAFVAKYGLPSPVTQANVLDSDAKLAKYSPSGKVAFVSVPSCLEKLGHKQCSKCNAAKLVELTQRRLMA